MYYYILNPTSSSGSQLKGIQEKLQARLKELHINGEWVKATAPGEASRMAAAAAAKGFNTIVAVGDDDTVNEVVNGLAGHDGIAIGIIPLGRGNHLASQFGITGWQQACDVLAARRLTPYSLIAAGQKFFLSTLTLGFETELEKNLDTTEPGWRALATQLWAGWGQAKNYRTLRAHISVDDAYTLDCDLFSLSIANQKFLNPSTENRLIVTISNHPGHQLQLGSYLWQLLRQRTRGSGSLAGTTNEESGTTRFLAGRVVIETDPPTGIMVDGKVAGRTPIAIRLTDRRVRFITEKVTADFKEAVTRL